MLPLTEDVRATLRLSRRKTIVNSLDLLQTAVALYREGRYPPACLSAMTCIEEVGKLQILRFVQGDVLIGLRELGFDAPPPTAFDASVLDKFLRNHLKKAVQAAAMSLHVNAGADQRHGIDPISGIHRTSGVVLLARSGRWMDLRNGCQYTDISLRGGYSTSPCDIITRAHAYYFICMGFEVLAEHAEAGFGSALEAGSADEAVQFWKTRLRELMAFMASEQADVDLSSLDFLNNPEPLRLIAEQRENG